MRFLILAAAMSSVMGQVDWGFVDLEFEQILAIDTSINNNVKQLYDFARL
jgi:hypothetical protein